MVVEKLPIVTREEAVPSGSFLFQTIYRVSTAVNTGSDAFLRLSRDVDTGLRIDGADRAPMDAVLKTVCRVVEDAMSNKSEYSYLEIFMMETAEERSARQDGRDIVFNTDDFIEARVGVCRYQAPVAAALMKKSVEDLRMEGEVRIHIGYSYSAKKGLMGHAWASCRSEGQKYIIDPAMNFVGSASEKGQIAGHSLNRKTGEWEDAAPSWNYDGMLQRISTTALLSVTSGLSWADSATSRLKELVRTRA